MYVFFLNFSLIKATTVNSHKSNLKTRSKLPVKLSVLVHKLKTINNLHLVVQLHSRQTKRKKPSEHKAVTEKKTVTPIQYLKFKCIQQKESSKSQHSPASARALGGASVDIGMHFRAFFFALRCGIRVRYFLSVESEGCRQE